MKRYYDPEGYSKCRVDFETLATRQAYNYNYLVLYKTQVNDIMTFSVVCLRYPDLIY